MSSATEIIFKVVARAKFFQMGHARHGAVFIHDFADDAGGSQPRQARQIHGCFGLTGSHQHAALAGPQGKHVSGPGQIGRPASWIDGRQDGARPIGRRNSGGYSLPRVDRLAKRGAEIGGVLGADQGQAQLVAAFRGQRQADQAAAVGGHEIDDLGGDLLRRDGQVALVFPVFVVHHHHDAPGADLLDRLRHRDKGHNPL